MTLRWSQKLQPLGSFYFMTLISLRLSPRKNFGFRLRLSKSLS